MTDPVTKSVSRRLGLHKSEAAQLSVAAVATAKPPHEARSAAGALATRRLVGLGTLADYWSLTKPRITLLNLLTTFAASWLASGGRASAAQVGWTLLGTALAVASGAVLNCWVERDRDRLMERTSRRPLPAGRIAPANALLFGLLLGVAGTVVLALKLNLVSAAVAAGGIVFYAGIYTALLKPRTHWNTVLGGIAGSVPPLIGWTAVTGGLDPVGLAVAGIVFLWQPVHFWALALGCRDDYARAGIKMLPVTHGPEATSRQILLYTLLLVAASVWLAWLGAAGPYYLAVALIYGAFLLLLAVQNLAAAGADLRVAWRLFHGSNAYLALLFLLLVLDCRCG